MLENVDKIYSMGCDVTCDLPNVHIDEDLQIEDPQDKDIVDIRKIRDDIKNKIQVIIHQLK